MSGDATQEYDDDLIAVLEAVWGEGFMSPGGTEEVDRLLQGLELSGRSVLDIGCGLGGMDMHLAAAHRARLVTGIDVESNLIERCERLAGQRGLTPSTRFVRVEPGPLPFSDAEFDFVTSKDSIIHIPDKRALAREVHRVLRSGGWFAVSDWLAGHDGEASAAMRAYVEAEGLDFGLASAATYTDALSAAGFVEVETFDRNEWYRARARHEHERLSGSLYDKLSAAVGTAFVDHEIDVWHKMIAALDEGELRPTHLRGRKHADARTA